MNVLIFWTSRKYLGIHNLPAPVINEADKYIINISIAAKLYIGILDYCLYEDEPST